MSPDQSTSAHQPAGAPSTAEGTGPVELNTETVPSPDNQQVPEPTLSTSSTEGTSLPVESTEVAGTSTEQLDALQPNEAQSEAGSAPVEAEGTAVSATQQAVSTTADAAPTVESTPTADVAPSAESTQPEATVAVDAAETTPTTPVTPPAPVQAASSEVVVSGKPIVLPNGKAGEAYSFKFNPEVIDLSTCQNVRVLGPEGLGLTFDQNSQTLAGKPSQAGEHVLRLSYQPAAAKPTDPTHIRTLQWYVNPDPRSLWTEHEPGAELTARKQHVAQQLLIEGPKALVAASRRGRSHAKDAKFREDDFRCYYQADANAYVLAVADGAGSANMSREGSRLACEIATQHLLSALSGGIADKIRGLADTLEENTDSADARKLLQDELYKLLGNAALIAARHITQTAEAAGHVVRDYATTLLLTLCLPTTKGWLVGAFWIGDGGLGLYRREGGIRLLGEPDGGEYSGQTRFLTMKETFEASSLYGRVRFELVPDFDALVLMTDGITDALFQTDSNLAKPEKWQELLDSIHAAAPLQRDNQALDTQLAEWLNFWVKGEYDDRTIAILF